MRKNRRIHVVDDDDAARLSLGMILTAAGYNVSSHASAESFLTQCRDYTGCVVSDVCMSGMDGLSLVRHLRNEQRECPVVLISGHADVKMAVAAMTAGAAGFLEKPFHVDELLKAVEAAFAGRTGRSASWDGIQRARRRLQGLTPREREVLHRLVAGNSNKQTARTMGVSPRTVEFHRAHIVAKTGAKALPELVRLYVEASETA
jgi:two-component system, LuxR family, response regulator FixJ